ncbi:MAG: redoxin family protein [Lautropia sp.]
MHDRARRRLALSATTLALTAGTLPARLLAQDKGPPLPPVGAPLVLPPVPMLDGTRFDPAGADGRILVVYWWASWCPFCAQQSPEMDKLWRARGKQGLMMLGLSIDKKPQAAIDYLKRKGYVFPSGWVDADVARALPKPKGLPVTIVRGRDGRIIQAEQGQMFPEDVELMGRWLDA